MKNKILFVYLFIHLALFIGSIIIINKCKFNSEKKSDCPKAFFVGVIGAAIFGLALLSILFMMYNIFTHK